MLYEEEAMRRSNGEGSIVRRPNGCFQVSLQVGGIRRTVYAKTRKEALRRLEELRRQAALLGELPDPGNRTLADLLDAFLSAKTDVRPRTQEQYAWIASLWKKALGNVPLARLTPYRLEQALARFRGRTAQLAYFILSAALRLAVRWRWLAVNPLAEIPPPRHSPSPKKLWSRAQLHAFLEGARGHPLFPLFLLLLSSGIRLGEALALSWEDVDLEENTIRIAATLGHAGGAFVRQRPKTPHAERKIVLPAPVVRLLGELKERQGLLRLWGDYKNEWGLVFTSATGRPLYRFYVAHALKKECRRLGLPPITPHGLRHLHASLLLDEGVPSPLVSARLGHAHPAITLAIYAHKVGGDDQAVEAIKRVLSKEEVNDVGD